MDRVLAAGGVAPQDISTAVFSHLHFDHIGGIEHIPQADLLVSAREWADLADPHPDRDLVAIGIGKVWNDAGSNQAIIALDTIGKSWTKKEWFTVKKIRANPQQNAQSSTGPTRLKGNRIAHGILSNKLSLDGEPKDEYQTLIDDLHRQCADERRDNSR